jgi:hypothetical protein
MLSIQTIKTIFTEEITDHQGTLQDVFEDGSRLFARSILPRLADIKTGDRVQGGVAIRATDEEIAVHPYVYRLICKNGMIRGQTIETRRLVVGDLETSPNAQWEIREAIRACCDPTTFANATRDMRAAVDAQADMALSLMPFINRMPKELQSKFLSQIFERFRAEGGGTRYNLLNAVTSLARDTSDPQQKWELEELGGAIAASNPAPKPQISDRRKTPLIRDTVTSAS